MKLQVKHLMYGTAGTELTREGQILTATAYLRFSIVTLPKEGTLEGFITLTTQKGFFRADNGAIVLANNIVSVSRHIE